MYKFIYFNFAITIGEQSCVLMLSVFLMNKDVYKDAYNIVLTVILAVVDVVRRDSSFTHASRQIHRQFSNEPLTPSSSVATDNRTD